LTADLVAASFASRLTARSAGVDASKPLKLANLDAGTVSEASSQPQPPEARSRHAQHLRCTYLETLAPRPGGGSADRIYASGQVWNSTLIGTFVGNSDGASGTGSRPSKKMNARSLSPWPSATSSASLHFVG